MPKISQLPTLTNITTGSIIPVVESSLTQKLTVGKLFEFLSGALDQTFTTEVELMLSASSLVTTSSFNSYTSSNDGKWNTLGGQTGSFITEAETGSFVTNVSMFLSKSVFDTYTGSAANAVSSAINAATSSLSSSNAALDNIQLFTSSFNTFTSSVNSFSASVNGKTGSYATTGSNTFIGNQTITGSLSVSGSLSIGGDVSVQSSETIGNFIEQGIFVNKKTEAFQYSSYNGGPQLSLDIEYQKPLTTGSGINTLAIGFADETVQTTAFIPTTYATTGSNQFNGNQTITGSLNHGLYNTAAGENSHAEGDSTQAIGNFSHAEGLGTIAYGGRSHAEGQDTIASGSYSHAEGYQTIALADHQHVQGQFNATSSVLAAFIVGNGTDDSNRSNLIHAAGNTVEITGSLNVSGSIYKDGNKQFNYGQWASLETQTGSADTAYAMKLEVPVPELSGLYVGNNGSGFPTRIYTEHTGLYNIQFSAQLHTTSNESCDFSVWFAMTGSNIVNSNTDFSIEKVSGGGFQVAALNFLTPITSGSYVELYWSKTTANGQLQYKGTQSTPTRPATPSVIVTVTQVA
jgi:hypothetical protein